MLLKWILNECERNVLIFVFWIANRSLGDIIDFDQELIPVNHEAKLKTSIHVYIQL